jgi:hypothetical protein
MGAWEEDGDTCTVLRDGDCSVSFGSTSDAICECSADEGRDEGAPLPAFHTSRGALIRLYSRPQDTTIAHNLKP